LGEILAMMVFRLLIPFLLISLGACSSDKFQGADGFTFVKSMAQNKLAAKNQSPPENPLATLTRSQLAGFSGPLILAHLETNNAYSSLSSVGTNGNATTFITPDQISLTLNNGVLIASRGLGGDLLSSDASSTLSALKRKDSDGFKRIHRRLDAEDHIISEVFDCILKQGATEKIEVVEKTYIVDTYLESCKNETHEFQNSYSISRKDGNIIVSRQWISPSIRYINLWMLIE
jgi:hypothetical protein